SRSCISAKHIATITTVNGSAAMKVRFWMPESAALPPIASMTAATAPVAAPQKTTTQREGASEPRCDSVPITTDAASAPETKKMATSSITTAEVIPVNGNSASTLKV